MLHENKHRQRFRFDPYQNTGIEWGSIVVLDIWARLSRQENMQSYFQIEIRMRWKLIEEIFFLLQPFRQSKFLKN